MATTEVGDLTIRMAMNAGEFDKGARTAVNSIASMEGQILKFAASWEGALTAAVVAAGVFAFDVQARMSKAVEDISSIGKAAQKVGMTTEAFSQFQYAAQRSGLSAEDFANSVKKLSVNLQDGLKGGSNDATVALRNMGVTVTDVHGKLKPTGEILLALAEKFKTYEDSANKTAIAVALFGRAGVDMIPFLNKGADGIAHLTQKADELGLTVNGKSIKSIKEMKGVLADITGSVDGFYRQLVEGLAPSLKGLVTSFAELNKTVGLTSGSISAAKTTVEAITGVLGAFKAVSDPVITTLGRLKDAFAEVGKETRDSPGYKQWQEELLARTKQLDDESSSLNKNATAVSAWATSVQDSVDEVVKKLDAPSLAKSKLGEEIATITKQIAALHAMQQAGKSNSLINLDASVGEALDAANKKLTIMKALSADLKGNPKLNNDVGAAVAMERLNVALSYGKDLTEQYLTPTERMEKAQQKINEAFRVGAINVKTMAKAQADNSTYSQKNLTDLADQTANTLDKIFGQTKAVAIATALINTYKGVTAALSEYPPPISFAMAALQMAAGMAQVMNIRNQGKDGGAAAASTSSAAVAAAPVQSKPQENTLLVQGISPGQLFSGDVVRDLAGRLLDFQKDGGKVVLA